MLAQCISDTDVIFTDTRCILVKVWDSWSECSEVSVDGFRTKCWIK